jgi:hypothetical protein
VKEPNSKIYFLTFCSEGEPHDKGKSLVRVASKIKYFLSSFFDDVLVYTPRTLKSCEGSENFCNFHHGEFSLNPGLNSLGCGDFKSFIIDKTLNEIEEGAYVLYHDCNFEKYPQYWQTDWENLISTFNILLKANNSDFFMPFESLLDWTPSLVRSHGKRYTTNKIIGDPIEAEMVSRCYEIASSKILIRNTERSREFFSEFKNLCLRKDLLTLEPNPNPYPEFTHSCPEQHVLNCLIYKYILEGKLEPGFPRYMFYNRKLKIDHNLMLFENHTLSKYMTSKYIGTMIEKARNQNK